MVKYGNKRKKIALLSQAMQFTINIIKYGIFATFFG